MKAFEYPLSVRFGDVDADIEALLAYIESL